MCVGDVTPMLFKRDDRKRLGYTPDFNTMHKCRNVDAIGDWTDEHRALY